MINEKINLLLADDDNDDCIFFKEALEEIPVSASLFTVKDGEELMLLLMQKGYELPHAIFLDLNMPRKNGYDCLTEIKRNDRLKHLPVIIYSTSLDELIVDLLHQCGATYCFRKPAEFFNLKKVILKSITLLATNKQMFPAKEEFLINSN